MASVKGSRQTPGKKQRTKRNSSAIYSAIYKENKNRLSVIISVQQNEKTFMKVLREAEKLHPKEILVVINGSNDLSLNLVLTSLTTQVTSFMYPFPLGQDVWRSIGAQEASGEVLLFLDGDNVIIAKELHPFILACYRGTDVALRKTTASGSLSLIQLAKTYVNSYAQREDLGFSSMIELPFAITKKAVDCIGTEYLLVPPLALVIAIKKGLRVEHTHQIREGFRPKKQVKNADKKQQDLVRLGDHLEAISYLHASLPMQ